MWFPYQHADSNMRFRFLLRHEALGPVQRHAGDPPDTPAAATA